MQAVLERIEWNQNKMRLALLWPPPYLFFFSFSLSLSSSSSRPPTTNARLAGMRQHVTSFGWLGCTYICIYVKERRDEELVYNNIVAVIRSRARLVPRLLSVCVCVAPISIVKVMPLLLLLLLLCIYYSGWWPETAIVTARFQCS